MIVGALMGTSGTAFLMYHELSLPGRSTCHREPGYARYVVPASDFSSHIKRLADEGWRGFNVSEAIQSFGAKKVCITFDDGCETDLISAAPVLKELGFGATSYITVEFLGQPGYMSHAQVRELQSLGFEIGCHSLTHPYLTDLDDARLREETAGAKDRLEQIAGVRVDHYSCPGGRWDARVRTAVQQSSFRTMATSATGLNFSGTDRYALNRVAILKGASSDQILRMCGGQGLLMTQIKERTRQAARRILGNKQYDAVREFILGEKQKTDSAAH
jgi:peptidoglycan/xylan/chitin deacetylase (PgdA/CDA1 family)